MAKEFRSNNQINEMINNGELSTNYGFKNYIINPAFDVWQRGDDFGSAGGVYTADRWRKDDTLSSRVAINKTYDSVLNRNYARYRVLDTYAGGIGYFSQRVEDVRTLEGETVTVSVKLKDLVSSTQMNVRFRQVFGSGGSATVIGVAQQLITSTSLQTFNLTFDIPSISGKTIGDGSYLQLEFETSAESTCDIAFYEVQLEEGSVATPFEQRPYGLELSLCQRYFEKGSARVEYGSNTIRHIRTNTRFVIEKRTVPTITFTDAVGNVGKISETRNTARTDNVSPSIGVASAKEYVECTHKNETTALDGMIFTWSADAEL
jgi:hypothetical protein